MLETRDIEPVTINDYAKKMKEMTDKPVKLIEQPPAVEKGSWFQEFVLDRIIGFIRKAVGVKVFTQNVANKLVLHVAVSIAGREIVNERIPLI